MKRIIVLALFLGFLVGFAPAYSQSVQNGVSADITIHPVELSFKAHGVKYYKLFAYGQAMFVTKEKRIYNEIADHLPVIAKDGRSVTIVGSAVHLSSLLSLKQIRKIDRKTGVDLGSVTVYEVTGYQINFGPDEKKPGVVEEKKVLTYKPPGS